MSNPFEHFTTSDGGLFPSVGLGTWKIPDAVLPDLIPAAVDLGYRHFDCACDYGNEKAVGEGLKRSLSAGACTRDDLWITSKLWNTYHHPDHVRAACERNLADLGLDELDLYLIHFPVTLAYVPFEERYPPGWFFDPEAESPAMKPVRVPLADTWGAMEGLVEAGLVKRIGVCNFGTALIRDLQSYARIQPSVLQVEMHPYLTQQKLLRFCQEENITVTAFSPFGASSYVPLNMAGANESVLDDPEVIAIAGDLGKTPGQVVLRWAIQRGTVTIPKTQTVAHLRDNIELFDFELGNGEMTRLDRLDRNRRFNDPAEFGEAAFNTFYPIFD
ncbi:MAG: aldo/keto reductase [Verrucomicrobiales bacterium]|jgi:diketogulonate reductase-like aldo/keto reductase|nr:aldo/keto reductase [Verrucomicrobiales bacterium]MDP4790261.1 aldo/keto reductase [Verrucomicrobiales bacterium]MDP4940217.1 aldo/keto reductase [Verrucomicrobiales bacterium]MDP5004758.1 aldo/keto reductase [Verrucomicrobiales bacterium]